MFKKSDKFALFIIGMMVGYLLVHIVVEWMGG